MFDQAKEGDPGLGPYSVAGDGPFHILGPGGVRAPDTTFYMARKSALRRCRELNEASPENTPAANAARHVAEAEAATVAIDADAPGFVPLVPAETMRDFGAFGTGAFRTTKDGAAEHVPLEELFIFPEGEAPDLEPSPEELASADEVERFPSASRHEWLEDAGHFAAKLLRDRATLDVPAMIRVSVGWPIGRKAIGECWRLKASLDGHREVFVSPALDDGAQIVSVLVHELIHASLPDDAKHGPLFAKPARAVGLEGKLTATHSGDELKALIDAWVAERGPYPAKGIDRMEGRKKQTTRLLKAACPTCGYTVRLTRVWAEKGLPVCGLDGSDMELA